MLDDNIRSGLHEIVEGVPTELDLEAIRQAGNRKWRNRAAGLATVAMLVLAGTGVTLSNLANSQRDVIETDIAADGGVVDSPQTTESLNGDGPSTSTAPTLTTAPAPEKDEGAIVVDDKDEQASVEASSVSTAPVSTTLASTSVGDTSEPAQPGSSTPTTIKDDFSCESFGNGQISWPDHDQDLYKIYRSTDGGETWTWIGRTYGDTIFVATDHKSGHTYSVNYEAQKRTPCAASTTTVCNVNSIGVVSWVNPEAATSQIQRSIDGGGTYTPVGASSQKTRFTDLEYQATYRYRVVVAAASPIPCSTTATFVCQADGEGRLRWTDDGQTLYWIYRSTDGGDTNSWLDRTTGATTFTDPDYQPGYLYLVNYEGLGPKVPCGLGS